MMNPESYFCEASRQQREMTSTCSQNTRQSRISGDRLLFQRETLPSGCILYRLLSAVPGPIRKNWTGKRRIE
jgi:hypothetical protein